VDRVLVRSFRAHDLAERGLKELARSRLDARPGDGEAEDAAAQLLRQANVLAKAVPKIRGVPTAR